MSDKAPDIAKPRLFPLWLRATLGLSVVVVIGALTWHYNQPARDTLRQVAVNFDSDLPRDYFEFSRPDQTAEISAPETAPAAPDVAAPPPPPVATLPPVENVIKIEPAPAAPAPDQEEGERLRINAQRRGSGKVFVDVGQDVTLTTYTNTDKDFTRQGLEKKETSFPTDLSRTLTVDRNIPCILIEEINSELAGKIRCQVEINVYGLHGSNVLIPAGSKAVGVYEPLEEVGQRRLQVFWQRIITPDGINIMTNNAVMGDAMGRSGITGEVDNRNWDKYGMALLVSTVSAMAQLTVPVEDVEQKAAVDAFTPAITGVTAKILEQNLDIRPTVSIPAGSRVLIVPVEDVWFKEPVSNVVTISAVSARGINNAN